jgi:hypothetical protein
MRKQLTVHCNSCSSSGSIKCIKKLRCVLEPPRFEQSYVEQALGDISASLVRNTCLRSLEIIRCCNLRELDCFDKLLFDTSSIETISNSNHALENISICGHNEEAMSDTLPTISEQCLKLNCKNEDKAKVKRD